MAAASSSAPCVAQQMEVEALLLQDENALLAMFDKLLFSGASQSLVEACIAKLSGLLQALDGEVSAVPMPTAAAAACDLASLDPAALRVCVRSLASACSAAARHRRHVAEAEEERLRLPPLAESGAQAAACRVSSTPQKATKVVVAPEVLLATPAPAEEDQVEEVSLQTETPLKLQCARRPLRGGTCREAAENCAPPKRRRLVLVGAQQRAALC